MIVDQITEQDVKILTIRYQEFIQGLETIVGNKPVNTGLSNTKPAYPRFSKTRPVIERIAANVSELLAMKKENPELFDGTVLGNHLDSNPSALSHKSQHTYWIAWQENAIRSGLEVTLYYESRQAYEETKVPGEKIREYLNSF